MCEHSLYEIIRCQSFLCALEVESVFRENNIIITKIRTKTRPESVDHFWIESMPEIGVEILSSLEKIQDIEEMVGFVDMHTLSESDFLEFPRNNRILKNDFLFFVIP